MCKKKQCVFQRYDFVYAFCIGNYRSNSKLVKLDTRKKKALSVSFFRASNFTILMCWSVITDTQFTIQIVMLKHTLVFGMLAPARVALRRENPTINESNNIVKLKTQSWLHVSSGGDANTAGRRHRRLRRPFWSWIPAGPNNFVCWSGWEDLKGFSQIVFAEVGGKIWRGSVRLCLNRVLVDVQADIR